MSDWTDGLAGGLKLGPKARQGKAGEPKQAKQSKRASERANSSSERVAASSSSNSAGTRGLQGVCACASGVFLSRVTGTREMILAPMGMVVCVYRKVKSIVVIIHGGHRGGAPHIRSSKQAGKSKQGERM